MTFCRFAFFACLVAGWMLIAGRLSASPTSQLTLDGQEVVEGSFIVKKKADSPKALEILSAEQLGAESIRAFTALPDWLVITFDDSQEPDQKLFMAPNASSSESPRAQRARQRMKDLMNTGKFEYVEPDYIVRTCLTPNDAAFTNGTLWGLRNTGQSGGIAGNDIEAVNGWDQTTGSNSVIVAVIDTGVRYTHTDLAANMWTNPGEIAGNGIDDDSNGYIDDVYGINAITGSGNPMDDNGHGTHCAGTIGAVANGGGAHVGVAWNVKIMALKFLSASGSGSTSDAIECIDYAVRKGAKILSNSWGGGGFSTALRNIISFANTNGAIFIAAAGNEANNNDVTPSYPANYDNPNVISVAAYDRSGNLASFSNYGASTVDIGAPGVSIYSTSSSSNTAYTTLSGTSMATPHVAGVAALLRARFPSITVSEMRSRLLNFTRRMPSLVGRTATGGSVSASRSLQGAVSGEMTIGLNYSPVPATTTSPTTLLASVTSNSPVLGATVTGTINGATPLTFLDNGLGVDATANDGVYSTSAQFGSAGSKTIAVSASAPSRTPANTSVVITVEEGAINDQFSSATSIPPAETRVTGSNSGATKETGEPNHAGRAAGKSVWWRWTAGSNASATITTFNSSFDTVLGIYTGSGVNTLTTVGSNDDSGGTFQSSVTFNATAGTTYFIAVDSYSGTEGGNITLNVPAGVASPDSAPIFTRQPENQNRVINETATFQVDATASPAATYRWYKENDPLSDNGKISGANTATLQVFNVSSQDVGSYYCVASNSAGSATSESAFLAVSETFIPPENDDFSNRITLTNSQTVTASNLYSSSEPGEPEHGGITPERSVWWTWKATTSGQVSVKTQGSSFDTTLGVYQGSSVASLNTIASNDDSDFDRTSAVSFLAEAGQDYQIAVDGYNGSTGSITLELRAEAPSPEDFIGDLIPPEITISGPRRINGRQARFRTRPITITGTAQDNLALAGVFVSIDRRAFRRVEGTDAWSFSVRPARARFRDMILRFKALDRNSNFSTVRTVTIVFQSPRRQLRN